MIRLSLFNLEKKEDLLLEEINIRQDFDLLKNYKFYFPHNNCEMILEKLKQSILMKTKRKTNPFSPRKKKNKESIKFKYDSKNLKVFPKVKDKEKSVLVTFLRKPMKIPSIFQRFTKNDDL